MRHLLALTLCLFAAVPALAQEDEDDGGGFLERQLERLLSSDDRDVTIRGFQGALSSRATLETMTISDADGVWLTLENAALDWNRSALLRGRLEVEELSAERLSVQRPPLPAEPQMNLPTPEAQPFSLPDLPVSVNIGQLAIDRVELGEPLFGESAVVSLEGQVQLADGDGSADIQVDRIDGEDGSLSLDAGFQSSDSVLNVDLAVQEGPGGILATLMNIPDQPAVSATVQGSGPLSDFTAEIDVDTAGEDRLAGTVELASEGSGEDLVRSFDVDLGGDVAAMVAPEYRPFFGPDIQLQAQGQTFADGRVSVDQLALSAQALALDGSVLIGPDGLPREIALEGEIASPEGDRVVLPFGGGETSVQRVGLDVGYDAAEGEDWTGEIVVEALQQPGVEIATLRLDGTGQIVVEGTQSVTADLDFGAQGLSLNDAGLQAALGEDVTGTARIAWEAGAPVDLEDLQIGGRAFALTGSGQVDATGDAPTASLQAQLDAEDLQRFSQLAGRDLGGAGQVSLDATIGLTDASFNVAVDGQTTDLSVAIPEADALLSGETDLTLRAERDGEGTRVSELFLGNDKINLTGSADLRSEDSTAQAELSLPDASVVDERLEGGLNVAFTAEQPGADWEFDLTGEGLMTDLRASGTLDLPEPPEDAPDAPPEGVPQVSADLSFSARDLEQFALLTGLPLDGSIEAEATASGLTDASIFDVQLDGTLQSVEVGIEQVDALLQGETELGLDAAREGANSVIQLSRLQIENPQITVNGQGQYSDGESRVTGTLRLEELSEIVEGLSGPVTADVVAQQIAEGWQVSVDAEAAEAVLEAMADVTELDSGTPLIEGTARLDAADLSNFAAIANRPLAGAADLRIEGRARSDASTFEVTVNGTTRDVETGIPQADGLLGGTTELSAEASRSSPNAAIELPRLELSNPQLTLAAEGRYGAGQSVLDAELSLSDLADVDPGLSGPAEATVAAQEIENGWSVEVNADADDAVLDAVAEITDLADTPLVDGELTLAVDGLSRFSGLAGRQLGGSLRVDATGQARADASAFDVEANVDGQNLSVGIPDVDRLLGSSTQVVVDASKQAPNAPIQLETARIQTPTLRVTADGQVVDGQSRVNFDARLADIAPYAAGISGPVTANGTAAQTSSGYSLDIDATGPGGTSAAVSGTVSNDFGQLDLDVTGQAPLGLANRFIEPRSVAGTLNFNIAVDGPPGLDAVSGRVTTTNARFVAPSLALVLDSVNLSADISNGTAQLQGNATKQEGGTITVSGPIQLSGGFDAALDIVADSLVVEDPSLYRTSVSGELGIDGPLTGGASIAGTLQLGETELRIPSTGLGATGPIPEDITHLNEPADVRATRRRAGLIDEDGDGASGGGGGGVAYPLDITISAPNRIFIRGRGLDAELGGELTIEGTTANVIPAGQFDLIRGRLDILGQRLDLVEGSVTLQGDFSPVVRLVAETDADDTVVRIVVEGTATSPEIGFTSSPELPEEEVLSRLLFGRSISNISPLQAAQLASAVATLAGRGGGGVINNLRNSFGLDDLDITTTDEGNAAVRAGTYISENVYTDVTVDSEGEAEVNLNLDVSESVTVTGSAKNDGETSLGVFFERDY